MTSTVDYFVAMHGTKMMRDPSSFQEAMGLLEIHISERYQLYVRTTDGSLIEIEDITSPKFGYVFDLPPHVLGLPILRKGFILDVLKTIHIDNSACEDLRPKIESFVIQASENYGVKEFAVVVEVQITKTDIYDYEKAAALIGG